MSKRVFFRPNRATYWRRESSSVRLWDVLPIDVRNELTRLDGESGLYAIRLTGHRVLIETSAKIGRSAYTRMLEANKWGYRSRTFVAFIETENHTNLLSQIDTWCVEQGGRQNLSAEAVWNIEYDRIVQCFNDLEASVNDEVA